MPYTISPLSPVPFAGDKSRLSELALQRGQNIANAALASGQNWQNALQGVGSAVAQGVQAHSENKAMSRQAQAVSALFDNPEAKPEDFIRVLGPDKGLKAVQALQALHPQVSYEDEQKRLSDAASGVLALPPEARAGGYARAREQLIKAGRVDPSMLPEQYDENLVTQAASYGKAPKGEPKLERVEVNNPDGSTTIRFVDPRNAGDITSAAKPKEDTRSLDARYADAVAKGDREGAAKLLEAKRQLETAGRAPGAARAGKIKETDRGFVIVDPTTGEARPVTMDGTQVAGPKGLKSVKPATGIEKKAVSFFNRMQEAERIASGLEGGDEISPVRDAATAGLPLVGKIAGNFLNSDANQSYRQAQRAFTEARLRKESGAAVPDSEYENDAKTYFVQPGDSAATIRQKAAARRAVMAGVANESGTALEEFYGDEAQAIRDQLRGSGGSSAAPAGAIEDLRKKYNY